jgi:hypothetical protein
MDSKEQNINLNHDNPTLNDILAEHEPASDTSLLRRIDVRILPIMFLAYFLQFLDKVCLNVSTANLHPKPVISSTTLTKSQYANVMGIQDDLSMSGNDFSWLATAFFIAYAIAEVPQGAHSLHSGMIISTAESK